MGNPQEQRRAHRIVVYRGGRLIIDAQISMMHARSIALMSIASVEHLAEFPQHAERLNERISLTIEAALQGAPRSHVAWLEAVASGEPIEVDVHGVSGDQGGDSGGGHAAWPGAGGGGGGAGFIEGGVGGNGSDGAIAIWHIGADDTLIDVEVFVLPGRFIWRPPGYGGKIKVMAWGGGGGGGAGTSMFPRAKRS